MSVNEAAFFNFFFLQAPSESKITSINNKPTISLHFVYPTKETTWFKNSQVEVHIDKVSAKQNETNMSFASCILLKKFIYILD